MPGPPIRKPSDHSPPAGSPRNIAGHHVLHRPLMPRHPPNAHKNKQNTSAPAPRAGTPQRSKMLASTMQFTTNPPTNPVPTTRDSRPAGQGRRHQGALPQTPTACHPTTHQPTPPPHRAARTGDEQQAAAPQHAGPPPQRQDTHEPDTTGPLHHSAPSTRAAHQPPQDPPGPGHQPALTTQQTGSLERR